MIIRVSPSTLRGEVQAPPSKSVMQRLVAGALLAEGTSTLHNISQSDDCTAALLLAAQLGAEIELDEQSVRISGTGGKLQPRTARLTPGESGLAARLFTPIAGLATTPLEVIAEKSLMGRPMHVYEALFEAFGGRLTTTEGTFPVAIESALRGGRAALTDPFSSQFTTGMLFAMPLLDQPSSLTVANPTSTPYLNLTLEILADFGIQVESEDHTRYACDAGQSYQPLETVVDGDWSGAAALAVASMVAAESSISIHGLDNTYTQADESIRGALLFAGGALSGIDGGIQVAKRPVRAFQIDLTESPDLFPVLAALAAFAKKPSTLFGIGRLIHKESNRAQAIQSAWEAMGIRVELDVITDTMTVHPWGKNRPTKVIALNPRGDHRMVMAYSILAVGGSCPIEIEDAECVAKSYPEFFDDLATLGASLQTVRK
jgi:3-phosphoshikimate 1-carboxyvinyltransferase